MSKAMAKYKFTAEECKRQCQFLVVIITLPPLLMLQSIFDFQKLAEGRLSSSYKDNLFLLLEHVEDFVMERMLTSCTGIL